MWRLLIVDDDIHILQRMEKALPWHDLQVELVGTAMDGIEGFQHVKDLEVDIVITDIYMPDMNGIEMIEALRKDGYEGKVVILSGYSDFEHARQALRLNVDDYISKPVTVDNLEKIILKMTSQLEKEMHAKMEQVKLKQKLREYEPFVTKGWIKEVLTGTIEDRNIAFIPEPKEIWLERHHLVLGVELLRIGRLDIADNRDWNLFRFAVGNVIEEVVVKEWRFAHYSELHGSHGALLLHLDPSLTKDLEQLRRKLEETCALMTKIVFEYLKVSINIGIGTVKENYNHIADSTEEAFQALLLKQKPLPILNNTFEYEHSKHSIKESNGTKNSLEHEDRPVKLLRLLSDAIITANQSEVNKLVSEYMKQVQRLQPVTPLYVQVLGAELWYTLSSALLNSGVEMEKIYPNMNLISELEKISKLSQLVDWFLSKLELFYNSRLTNHVSYKHKQTIEFMLEYIHGHLDKQLTLDELAGLLFISKNHLNQIFKKATGDTFNTYLTRVRMEKAKALMQEGKYMIYEIAEKVGYLNVPYFSTIFKKHVGQSPSDINNKYRNVIIDKN